MLGLSIPSFAYRQPTALAARVNALFRSGEQGVWYDPSDRATLFQDAAGTTPVTAVEQPVGLILDKSKGLVLGPELVTNGFSSWSVLSGSWTLTSSSATGAAATGFIYAALQPISNGYYEISGVVSDYTGGNFFVSVTNGSQDSVTVSANGTFSVRCFDYDPRHDVRRVYIKGNAFSGTITNISIKVVYGNHAYQSTSASRPVLSARVNQYVGTATLATQNVTTLAATYTLRFEGTGSITLSGTATGTYSAGTHSVVCTAGTLTSTVTGTVTNADIRVANVGVGLPVYQRVTTDTDYDTVSYPFFLRFDGVDDSLVTSSIDFTATDKMTVVAGVRKLSDAKYGQVVELSVDWFSNNGTFALSAPFGHAASNYAMVSKGTFAQSRPATYAAPHTAVLTGFANISAPLLGLKVNGGDALTYPTSQGTGNYGNYPLYIGSRAGSSLRFNGHLYSLVVRGAASSDAQIAATEKYVNQKTKAYA